MCVGAGFEISQTLVKLIFLKCWRWFENKQLYLFFLSVANIGGSLIAVLAFIAFVNGVLGWFCELIGYTEITIQKLLGYLFIPLAWLMGVETKDLQLVGELLGLKSFLNEFVAYSELNKISGQLSSRSKVGNAL